MKFIAGRGTNPEKFPACSAAGEFGVEILIAIAYQVYLVGLSFDKVCLLMNFFQHLRLRKSQVDALLKQLGAALRRRVRAALHAPGPLGRRACR